MLSCISRLYRNQLDSSWIHTFIQIGLMGLLNTFSNAQTYHQVFGVRSYHTTAKTCWKENSIPSQETVCRLAYYAIPRSIWHHCLISPWISKTLSLECMRMLLGNGCFVNFCTLGYYLAPIKVPNKLISPI